MSVGPAGSMTSKAGSAAGVPDDGPTDPMSRKVRRVVTGCDEDGRSVIVLDDNPPAISVGTGEDARTVVEVWSTISTSASTLSDQKARSSVTTGLGANATEIRVVEMPPGCRREMHRTDTVDYGLVQCGEMLLRAGDIIVQRGTNHLWHNRSDAPTRIAFVNMSGQTTDLSRCPDV